MGTVQQIDTDGKVTTPNIMITPDGGLAIRVYNNTGSTLLKGRVVKVDTGIDNGVVLTAVSDPDPVGIVYVDILTGQWGWIVVGGYAEVYVDNAGATPREAWIGVSTTTVGQCTSSGVPATATDHFRECGHTVKSRAGPGLVMSIIHFN